MLPIIIVKKHGMVHYFLAICDEYYGSRHAVIIKEALESEEASIYSCLILKCFKYQKCPFFTSFYNNIVLYFVCKTKLPNKNSVCPTHISFFFFCLLFILINKFVPEKCTVTINLHVLSKVLTMDTLLQRAMRPCSEITLKTVRVGLDT